AESACPAARRPALRAFPFGGSRTACRCAARVTPFSAASRGGSVPLGVLYADRLRGHRVSRSRQGLGISTGSSGFSPSTVHRELSHAVSSSLELSASFRVLRPTTCPSYPDDLTTIRDRRAPPVGFLFPHRDISRRRPLIARSSHTPS